MFPGAFGYNILCVGQEAPHFEEISPTWGYIEGLWLSLLEGEGALPFWKDSVPRRPDLSHRWIVDGSRGIEHSGKEVPSQQGGRGGLIKPPRKE